MHVCVIKGQWQVFCIFNVRQSYCARYWYRLSVCPSVRHMLVLCRNGSTYRQTAGGIRSPAAKRFLVHFRLFNGTLVTILWRFYDWKKNEKLWIVRHFKVGALSPFPSLPLKAARECRSAVSSHSRVWGEVPTDVEFWRNLHTHTHEFIVVLAARGWIKINAWGTTSGSIKLWRTELLITMPTWWGIKSKQILSSKSSRPSCKVVHNYFL